ncbi:leukocyte antigen CD37 isoform X3 [Danio rerio]|uniref:Leukocyte antigen CD37 isoform X3 n=1 Tax=Danio rerio TaxID=7955 RepID=A0AC58GUH4_DANRE
MLCQCHQILPLSLQLGFLSLRIPPLVFWTMDVIIRHQRNKNGSVTMSLGFFGCLGSLKTVKFLLAIYFILLTVLLAAQIVGGVLFYTMKTELSKSLGKETDLIQSFGRNDSSFKKTMDYIQRQEECCGWNGKEDWGDSIPCSCYHKANETKELCDNCSPDFFYPVLSCKIYDEGCKDKVENWLGSNLHFILWVILAISVVECLQWTCVIFYCCFNRTHRCCPRESHGSHVQLSRFLFVTSVVFLFVTRVFHYCMPR